MKKYISILILVLSLLLLFSCSGGEESKAGVSDDAIAEALSEYSIVYPECMGTYVERFTIERYCAQRLSSMIEERYDVTLEVYNDSEPAEGKEIILGNARGIEISEKNDYSVGKSGDNITINAGGIYSYTTSFNSLFSLIEKDGLIPEAIDLFEKEVSEIDTEKSFVYITLTENNYEVPEHPVKKLTLNGRDISEYKIIYHKWGSPLEPHYGLNEEYAAEQLQRYIKLATGVELPIETDESKPTECEIVVGITQREGDVIEAIDRSGYGEEDTLIKTEGSRLIISGAQRRGTIYAAYSFLEKYLGVRFFGVDCEVIYKADSIDISDVMDEYVSDMEFRDSNQKTIQVGEFASKRKVNSNFCRIMNYKQGGNFSFASEFPHTMGTVLDLDNSPGFPQPCFTDEATYQKALERTTLLLERSTDAKLMSVTQNDEYNHCLCSDCSKIIKEEGSPAGPLIHFINRLADDIKDEFPDVKILTFAYLFSIEPPKTAPRDNVVIMYCPIESCCGCALNDPDCPKNGEFAESLEGWLDLTDNVYIWYYVAEYTQNDTIPFMNFKAIYDNYKYFRSIGVKGMFNQGWMDDEGNEFDVMRAYVLSLLMWNKDMTYEEYNTAINEFIDAYYGEASELIKEYFYALETTSKGKHFTQYASLQGMFDTATLSELSEETDAWWEILSTYDYSSQEIKEHVLRLYRGYTKVKSKM